MSRADWAKLTRFLEQVDHDEITLTWDEFDAVVGRVPDSAVSNANVWWSGTRPNTVAWRKAGFEVLSKVPGHRVTFRRIDGVGDTQHPWGGNATSAPVTRQKTAQAVRREANLSDLIANFNVHLARFEGSGAFPGPSLYFHVKAIERRRAHRAAAGLLDDDRFLETVYAVLPAWGMHRMGATSKAKVGRFDDIVARLRTHSGAIDELWDANIVNLSPDDAAAAAAVAWDVIADIRVSTSNTQIVAGTKWLHHLLPDLIPPMDRQYPFASSPVRKRWRQATARRSWPGSRTSP